MDKIKTLFHLFHSVSMATDNNPQPLSNIVQLKHISAGVCLGVIFLLGIFFSVNQKPNTIQPILNNETLDLKLKLSAAETLLVEERHRTQLAQKQLTTSENKLSVTKKNLNEATKEVKKLQIAYQDLKATNKDLERDYKKRIEELSHFMSAIRLHSTIDKSVLTRSKSAVDKELDNGTN